MVSHVDHSCYITPSPSDPPTPLCWPSPAWGRERSHSTPSLRFHSTSAWLVFALKRALRFQSSFCPSPPGLQGWPALDFSNKIFHSLKLQHPTSCSTSLCFPETRLPWLCLSPIHPQTFSERRLWVRPGARDTKTTRLLPAWRRLGPVVGSHNHRCPFPPGS